LQLGHQRLSFNQGWQWLTGDSVGLLKQTQALLPLATSRSAMYSPLAWVIIGGLLSSLLLSRVVTPVLYSLLPPRGR
jgi:hypothetical protein